MRSGVAESYGLAQDDRAVAAFEKLVKLKPEAPEYRIRLAEHHWTMGEKTSAATRSSRRRSGRSPA